MVKIFFRCLFLSFSLITSSRLFSEEPAETEARPSFTILDEKQMPPLIENEGKFISEFFYMLLMLGILIGAMLLASRFLKKMATTRYESLNASSIIRVIESRVISQKTTLHLIETQGKSILIAETAGNVTSLFAKDLATRNDTL